MAQVTGTNVQATTGKGTSNFFAALRNGINLGEVQGKLFADLLMQAAAATQQQAANQAPGDTSSQPPVNETPASTISNINPVSNDDRAALRTLLQRIREDAQALHQNRQRIKHISTRQNRDDDDDQNTAAAPVAKAPADISAAKPTDNTAADAAANSSGGKTSSNDTTNTTAADPTAALAATTPVVPVSANTTSDAATTDDSDKVTISAAPATSDATDPKAILADMLQAEQAALLLLNKMLQDRINAIKAAMTGQTTPTDNATATDAVSADAGNVAAAANTAAAAPVASALAKSQQASSQQALLVTTDAPANPSAILSAKDTASDKALLSSTPDTANQTSAATPSVAKSGVDFSFLNLFNASAAPTPAVPVNATDIATAAKGSAVEGLSAAGGTAAQAATSSLNAASTNPILAEGAKPVGSYDFASQLSASRATKGGSAGLPSVVEQVALQLHKQVKDGVQEMTLQLRPAELGRVDIKLSFSDDNKVKGTVVADNQATLDLLSKDVGSLQRALQEAGLRADPGSLQFSLRGDGQASQYNASANGNGNSGFASSNNATFANEDDSGMTSDAGVETYYLAPGRVNLRV